MKGSLVKLAGTNLLKPRNVVVSDAWIRFGSNSADHVHPDWVEAPQNIEDYKKSNQPQSLFKGFPSNSSDRLERLMLISNEVPEDSSRSLGVHIVRSSELSQLQAPNIQIMDQAAVCQPRTCQYTLSLIALPSVASLQAPHARGLK